jgi:glucose/arabinose dehydrogenase
LTTNQVARGLQDPLDLQAPPGDRARVFVVEQVGRIRILRGTSLAAAPFLDLSSRISSGGERGLLGLAFHPRYSETGRFYVNYTDPQGDTHVSEFRVSSANPDVADAGSERELIFVRQPFANHNGGGLAFGNDGLLYIGLGDGGSGGDPMGNGQNLGTRLGKMLRIDVDRGTPFGVPADNPFVGRAGALPEIWAYGLRNPWRFAFDRSTGDLLIADVGQNEVEEVDLANRRGGDDFGWNVMEGSRCFRPSSGCSTQGLTLPILEYTHSQGCSITGGIVYRGCRLPGYQGTYFYGDYCTAFIRSFRLEGGRVVDQRDWTAPLGRGVNNITSFGTDGDGEAYIVDQDGEIYKIVPAG